MIQLISNMIPESALLLLPSFIPRQSSSTSLGSIPSIFHLTHIRALLASPTRAVARPSEGKALTVEENLDVGEYLQCCMQSANLGGHATCLRTPKWGCMFYDTASDASQYSSSLSCQRCHLSFFSFLFLQRRFISSVEYAT